MSGGPEYPRGPLPGSNEIGSFAVGISPVGTISAFDWWSTIISEFANSPILTQLVSNFFQYVDQTANIEAFFDSMLNIDTATGYGLDVWGRIVGVTRALNVVSAGPNFGFAEALPGSEPFNQAPFYVGAPLTTNYELTDDAFRLLIFAKALSNISDGSVASINQLLLNLFPGRGNCYVVDGLNLTMEYAFAFTLTAVELAIVGQSGVLPRPSGVSATVVQL